MEPSRDSLYRMILLSLCSNYRSFMDPNKSMDCDFKSQLAYDLMALKGHTITVTTVDNMPMSGTEPGPDGQLIGKGVAFNLFHEIQEQIGFKYVVKVPDVNQIGNETHGVIKLLHNKEVDMAVMFFPMLKEYRNFITFSSSLGEFDWVLFMKRPQASATGSGILAPFEGNVWYAILVSVLVVSPVTYMLVTVRNRLCKEDDANHSYSLSACVWFVYGALMKQGSTLSPMSDSARILFATWWIFITILTSFYTANLTAFLTLSQFTLTIKSPKEIQQYGRTWFADYGGQTYELINNADELKNLKAMVPLYGKFTDNPSEILPSVSGDSIYVAESRKATDMILRDYLNKTENKIPEADRCTYVLTKPFLAKPMAFGYPHNSSLQPLLNGLLGQLVQGGIVDFLLNKPLPIPTICPLNLASSERKLRNGDLKTTYYVVGAGFAAAMLVFLSEMVIRKWKSSDTDSVTALSINSGDIADHILGRGKGDKSGLPVKAIADTNYKKSSFLFQYTN